MNKRTSALETLKAVSLSSGYSFDLIQHLIDPAHDDQEDVEELPTDLEAGDLFRALVLDEHYSVEDAEAVYKAAMVVVRSVDRAFRKYLSRDH